MLKKFFYNFALTLAFFVFVVPAIAGPDIGIGEGGLTQSIASQSGYDTTGVNDTTLAQSIGRVIKVAFSLIGMVFLVLTIYAGILWMTASGNEEQVTNATNIVKRATMGLILVIAGYGLTVFVVLAITTATGTPGAQVGGAQLGATGFWQSFGTQFKEHWSQYILP